MIKIKKEDQVKCIDFTDLGSEVKEWLELKEVHKVKRVRNEKMVPIIELEPVDNKYPQLNGIPYPFLAERFEKVNQ